MRIKGDSDATGQGLRRLRPTLILVMIVGTLLGACGTPQASPSASAENRLKVWVSIVPQKYFVERIGADRVQVEVMVPPGASPETYEPKASQVERLAQADVYVRIRVPFEEAWMSRLTAANEGMLIVDQAEGIERIGGTDPHIWLSPRLVKVQAETICEGLSEADPAQASFYRDNLNAFLVDLDQLDASIERELSGLGSRKFMVFHPAWSYFARDYGLEMIAVQVEGSEPSAAEMAALIQAARANNIKVIFAQPEFNTRSAETIADEIGGEVVLISALAPDWMNNLQSVAETLARALGESEH